MAVNLDTSVPHQYPEEATSSIRCGELWSPSSHGVFTRTWFELTVGEPGGDSNERVRVTIASNVQGIDYTEHRIVIEDKRVLSAALDEDKVSIWATSPRPGWINSVLSAKVEMYVAY